MLREIILPMPDAHIGTGQKYHPTMHEVILRYWSAEDAIAAMERLEEARDRTSATHY